MNVWEVVTAVSAVLGLFVTVIAWAHTTGKLTRQVEINCKDIQEHRERLDAVDERINSNDIKIAKLEAWRDGYNAAVGAGVRKDGAH